MQINACEKNLCKMDHTQPHLNAHSFGGLFKQILPVAEER